MRTNNEQDTEFENLLKLITSGDVSNVRLVLQLRQGVKNERFETMLFDSIELYGLNVNGGFTFDACTIDEQINYLQRIRVNSGRTIKLKKISDLSLMHPRKVVIYDDIGLKCLTELCSVSKDICSLEVKSNSLYNLDTGLLKCNYLYLQDCDVRYIENIEKIEGLRLLNCKHLDEDTLSNIKFAVGYSNVVIYIDVSGSNIVTGDGLERALHNYFTLLDDTSRYMQNQRYRCVIVRLQDTPIAKNKYNLNRFMSCLRDAINEYERLGGYVGNPQKVVQLYLGKDAVKKNNFAQKLSEKHNIYVTE